MEGVRGALRDWGKRSYNQVPVAQLDRASASGAEGYRFESCRGYSKSFPANILRKEQPAAKGANGSCNSLSLQVVSSQLLIFFLVTELGQAVRKLGVRESALRVW